MKRFILPAIVFALCCFPFSLRAQDNSEASNTPLSPREKDELQARIYMAKKQYPDAIQVYSRLAQENPKDACYLNSLRTARLQEGKTGPGRKCMHRATQ